jgi:hypothetical protein
MPNISNTEKKSTLKKALGTALIAMLVLLGLWYLFFPILGIAITLTVGAIIIFIVSAVFLAAGVLLLYLFSTAGIIAICCVGLLWFLGALMLFPLLFPFLIPLLIILLFVGFIRKKQCD